MKRTIPLALITVLTLWGVLSTSGALRARKAAERALAEAADLRLDVVDLQKSLKKAESRPLPTSAVVIPQVVTNTAGDTRRVLELEAALREKDQLLASLRTSTTTNRPAWGPGAPHDGGASWLEDLKKNKPEEYEAYIKRREESRQRVQRAFAEKADHFLKRDPTKMSAEQQAAHKAMVTMIEQTWQLSEQLRTELPQEQRREIMGTMRDNLRELAPLLENERDNEFYMAGQRLGLNDAQAAQFVEQLNEAIDITSMRPLMDAMRGGGHGGGGFGPPGR